MLPVDPCERIRAQLRAIAPPDARVSDRRITHWFDEDRAAFADVTVSGPDDQYLLVVVRDYGAEFRELARRAWSEFAREQWFVDDDARTITRVVGDGEAVIARADDVLECAHLPGLRVALAELFA
jgi:hypothetical protein